MPSKRVMRGGNANVRPIEYYGGNSGRYFENPAPASSEFAYGNYHPVSHGVSTLKESGPNIGVLMVVLIIHNKPEAQDKEQVVFRGCSRAASRSRRSARGSSETPFSKRSRGRL